MTFLLASICFNHDSFSIFTSALNIRKNATEEIMIPEYEFSLEGKERESKVVYSIEDTISQNVMILATFVRSDFLESPPNAPEIYEIQASGGGILGDIDPIQITLPADKDRATVYLPLTNRNFSAVGKYNCTWRWKIRPQDSDDWISIESTKHTVYLILRNPQEPWSQEFGSIYNPWTDLLDDCCDIAKGTMLHNGDHFATMSLTKALNTKYRLKYDINEGAPKYGYFWDQGERHQFNLSMWKDYVLSGNFPKYPRFCYKTMDDYPYYLIVSCFDTAAALTLMASILGVEIKYIMHYPLGYLNYVQTIGRKRTNNPCYGCGNSTNAVVGEDNLNRSFMSYFIFQPNADHPMEIEDVYSYTRLNNGRIYDPTTRQYVPFYKKIGYLLLYIWLMIITLGKGDLDHSKRNKINGWLINKTFREFQKSIIDTSTQKEKEEAKNPNIWANSIDFY